MTKQSVQSGSGAAEVAVGGGRGVEATEEQARAIISMAKRAVEEEAKTSVGDGSAAAAAAGKPSLKRSLECFLEARKNKRRRLPQVSAASIESCPAVDLPSSSST